MALKVTTTVHDDTVEVVSAGSTSGEIATALLDAATDPADVRTVTTTTGMGWHVPLAVARKAGIVQTQSSRKSTSKN